MAGLLKEKGVAPGDRVGIMLPNVPYFGGGLLRRPARGRRRGADERAAEGPRGRPSTSSDSGAKVVFAWHEFAEAATTGAAEAGAEAILVKPGEFEQLWPPRRGRRGGRARALRHRGDPLHVRHDRHAQGRRAHACEPARELPPGGARARARSREDDVILGALPLFHSFGQTCCLNAAVAPGRLRDADPALRPGKALEIIARDRVTLFEGVPTMYHAHAQPPGTEDATTSRPAAVRLRRLGDAGRGDARASRRRSTASSSRATACRRPRRWPRSTTPTASASPARSARRSAASR